MKEKVGGKQAGGLRGWGLVSALLATTAEGNIGGQLNPLPESRHSLAKAGQRIEPHRQQLGSIILGSERENGRHVPIHPPKPMYFLFPVIYYHVQR